MFKVNDYVVYGSTGVCQITDIRKEKHIDDAETEYYILNPVFSDNMTVKIPVTNDASMRPILTRDAALALINKLPDKETIWINDSRKRIEHFKAVLKTRKSEEWAKLVKSIYREKQSRSAMGKSITKTDENILNMAEKNLYQELAVALKISPDEVVPYIHKLIS